MRSDSRFGFARKLPPTRCPDCNAKLGPLEHGRTFDKHYRTTSPSTVDGCSIWRACGCGCFILWSSRGQLQLWERRHVLPLFDGERVVVQLVDDFGKR